MTQRLILVTEIISPYRIPLFNVLAGQPGVDLHVVFLAETDPVLRQWHVYKDEIKFSYQVLPSWRRQVGRFKLLVNGGVSRALTDTAPDLVVCGGYSYLASWQTLLWARANNVPFLLWTESNQQDMRRGYPLVEFLKDEFLHRCNGFVVPGQSARKYLHTRKIRDEIIYTAPNAVDNDFYMGAAAEARKNASQRRRELNLPERYFLFVGRLVWEKGVFELLSAYATLSEDNRRQFGLVFVGDGVCRSVLEERAAGILVGSILFPGFTHREQLASYYALADMLVLPTYSDPWGLVVNEAMACGLPVILAEPAGCAADLVKNNWNGLIVSPRDRQALAAAMEHCVGEPELLTTMGSNSAQLIRDFSPEAWSLGIRNMMGSVLGHD